MAGVSKVFVSSKFSEQPLFRFTSVPKLAPECKRKKVAKRYDAQFYTNSLMSDPRVRRGSYVMDLGPTVDHLHYPCFEMIKKDPLCQLYLKGQRKCSLSKDQSFQATTKKVEPKTKNRYSVVEAYHDGKEHAVCQTDMYFEQLQTESKHIGQGSQTDPLSDFDASKLGRAKVRRAKIGDDKDTQIYPGELWDFNESVRPIVESLGASIIEQALYELMLEDELATLLDQQQVYENRKKAEKDRLARLQARQSAIIEENARIIQAELEQSDDAEEAQRGVSVTMFSKNYLQNLSKTALEEARKDGYLKNEDASEKQDNTTPSLVEWLDQKTTELSLDINRKLLDDIIENALKKQSLGW